MGSIFILWALNCNCDYIDTLPQTDDNDDWTDGQTINQVAQMTSGHGLRMGDFDIFLKVNNRRRPRR